MNTTVKVRFKPMFKILNNHYSFVMTPPRKPPTHHTPFHKSVITLPDPLSSLNCYT